MEWEKEINHYKTLKSKLLEEHKGKFALIKGETLYGVFSNFADAHREALKRFGPVEALIQEITDEERSDGGRKYR